MFLRITWRIMTWSRTSYVDSKCCHLHLSDVSLHVLPLWSTVGPINVEHLYLISFPTKKSQCDFLFACFLMLWHLRHLSCLEMILEFFLICYPCCLTWTVLLGLVIFSFSHLWVCTCVIRSSPKPPAIKMFSCEIWFELITTYRRILLLWLKYTNKLNFRLING